MVHRSSPADLPDESKSRALFARTITAVLIVMGVFMVGWIYWRWESVREPTTVVLICGDGSLEGAKIQVTGGRTDLSVALDSTNGWQTPILLDPGDYRAVVIHRDRKIRDERFYVDRMTGRRIDLPSMVVIVGGGQLADAQVEILRDPTPENFFTPEAIQLEAKNHYRTAIYLFPGNYHAIARSSRRPDQILAQTDFTVDRTTPLHIDLIRAVNEGTVP